MSQVKLQGNAGGSGSVTIAAPNTNSAYTATLPAATGDVMVSGNMPAFSAYAGATTSVTTGTFTKVALNTTDFDTNSYFDKTTNYRFTPLVAGYYQINASVQMNTTSQSVLCTIYKNGSAYCWGVGGYSSSLSATSVATALIYCNGSTDYIELYCYQGTGETLNANSGIYTRLSGSMVRAA